MLVDIVESLRFSQIPRNPEAGRAAVIQLSNASVKD